ncbi:hypothetical protein [Parasitella parasitica]|uniref:CCHC-type domain-containing protein n=1 Tax=Parasitella parasitica TaxID=35722 RepID=A0A0B7NEW6_9FUNG|nr:hypothetical protein [Parasitella parasitica]
MTEETPYLEPDTQRTPEMQSYYITGETNSKVPPKFSGIGFSPAEDPPKFLEDFRETAVWNNWVQVHRKKELFMRCLAGYARDWYLSEVIERPDYHNLPFESLNHTSTTISSLFQEKFVTAQWFEFYEETFEARKQTSTESATHYVCTKKALYKKANLTSLLDKTEKQLVKKIRKGLLPHLQTLCVQTERNPYATKDAKSIDSYAKLEQLLSWAEQDINKAARTPKAGVHETKEPKAVTVNNVTDSQPSDAFEKVVLAKLEKIASEVASSKELLTKHEKQLKTLSVAQTSPELRTSKGGGNRFAKSKCYNCHQYGHIAVDCTLPCICGSTKHISMNWLPTNSGVMEPTNLNPDNPMSSNVILTEESQNVNAISGEEKQNKTSVPLPTKEESRKSAEAIKVTLLKNLEKARAAKAEYKRLDDEAMARGEMPASILRKQAAAQTKAMKTRNVMPMAGPSLSTESSMSTESSYAKGTLQLLQGLHVNIPVVQLMRVSPEPRVKSTRTTDEDMEVDINHLQLDISIQANAMGPISLQSVIAMVQGVPLEFLIDGGAMISLIPMQVVKDLKLVDAIMPTSKIVRYGDGVAETPVGLIKLTLVLSEAVEITHTFCITKSAKTPLIIGMDFLKLANCLPDQRRQVLLFRDDQDEVCYKVVTHEGVGLLQDYKHYIPEGVEPEESEPLVLPVRVGQDVKNPNLLELRSEYDWTFKPGDTSLLMLDLKTNAAIWTESKVLQPERALWLDRGLYVLPTVLFNSIHDTWAVIMMNGLKEASTIKAGTLLGRLYSIQSSVPVEVEVIQQLEEVVEYLTGIFVNLPIHETRTQAPSMFEGPVYHPIVQEIQELTRVNSVQQYWGVHSVNMVEGPEQEMQFDISDEFTAEQKRILLGILRKYQSVFATFLKQVGKLNTNPYEIQSKKDAVTVKVAPRMIPHDAQEWFKDYLGQLLELGLIEPCSGPWAAGVVLVPTDAERRAPRRRKATLMRKTL